MLVFGAQDAFALICEEKDGESSRIDEKEQAFDILLGEGDACALFWRVLYFWVGSKSLDSSDE